MPISCTVSVNPQAIEQHAMLTLYDYLPSQNAWKIRALLNHLDKPYAQELISIFEAQGQSDEYLNVNPTGAVPAIKLDNGQYIAESNAILIYLARGTPYLPDDPVEQAQVIQWLFFESDYVQASIATLRHWVLTGKDRNRSKDVLDGKIAASKKALGILDQTLGGRDFLAGCSYTIADIAVYAYVHLAGDAGLKLDSYPHLQRWLGLVSSQPGLLLPEVFPYSIDEHSYKEL